ncbi:MAG: tRNA lysidine(34) synthetase TilS [Herminiimonas sp.]|nr:tRNA lysidine(34) synthetase TilS [Herminiimonas sp.]
MSDKPVDQTAEAFERALTAIRNAVSPDARPAHGDTADATVFRQARFAVALSGGLDSSVLLHLAQAHAVRHQLTLFAFHIHHGISPNADAWLAHCRAECERRGITFDSRLVKIPEKAKNGIEEAARRSRYAALGALCRLHGVPLLLTAHHQDDQAETVLLQLLRGSGVAGLSGMDTFNCAPDLLGDATLVMARPLLEVARAELEEIATSAAITHIDDESNRDPRHARNALRHQFLPALAEHFPGFAQRFARTARHAQAAQRMLVELAVQDLTTCLDGECLDISLIRRLSPDRIDNLLRYWFGSRGVRMPSTAWLAEMRSQLLNAKPDAQLCVTHADCHIRRHQGRVYLTPKLEGDAADVEPLGFAWQGEASMHFERFGGTLFFDGAEQGVDARWLRAQPLIIALRSGGERLKPAANRPTRSLKYHYQSCDVPAWQRERLPIVSAAKQLLFAAGIGMDCQHFQNAGDGCIVLRWQPDPGRL